MRSLGEGPGNPARGQKGSSGATGGNQPHWLLENRQEQRGCACSTPDSPLALCRGQTHLLVVYLPPRAVPSPDEDSLTPSPERLSQTCSAQPQSQEKRVCTPALPSASVLNAVQVTLPSALQPWAADPGGAGHCLGRAALQAMQESPWGLSQRRAEHGADKRASAVHALPHTYLTSFGI